MQTMTHKLYWLCADFNYKVWNMNWQEFTALLVLATAMSFTPGPNTTLSTALAANLGLRGALPFVFAVPFGWSALLLVCALGLGALVVAVPLLSWIVKLVGVAYLIWLAWKLSQSRQLTEAAAANLRVGFWQGVALQFVNIKAWMLALAIVSGWITGHTDATQRLAVVVPTMLAFALTSNFLYATAGSLLRDWLRGPEGSGERLRLFNRAMALVLLVTALWMLSL
jgi:threonine/homoserine/homoserine lactone efflux protein